MVVSGLTTECGSGSQWEFRDLPRVVVRVLSPEGLLPLETPGSQGQRQLGSVELRGVKGRLTDRPTSESLSGTDDDSSQKSKGIP